MLEIPSIKRNILLNPGPATTSDSVKLAQLVPDVCPRENEFGDLLYAISSELTNIVADDDYTCVLFSGSGTSAIESVITSVVDDSKFILIVNNGAYGNRMCEIANAYNLNYYEYRSSSVLPIDLGELEEFIVKYKDKISHLAVVHNETTTGLLNDLVLIGRITRNYGIELIVDAMSSFGAIPIDMKESFISYVVSSSNKNIQGMAGLSFVVANKVSIGQIKNVVARGYYLNLYAQYDYFYRYRQMRFTPPVQVAYALYQAILELKDEGVSNRYKRYCKSWSVLVEGVQKIGLSHLVEERYHGKIITSIVIPDKIDFNHMYEYFKSLGIVIYPGKLDSLSSFRIANIGAIDYNDMKLFVKYLTIYFESNLEGKLSE